jgi:hypothetical protein
VSQKWKNTGAKSSFFAINVSDALLSVSDGIGQRLMFKANVNFAAEASAAAWPSIEPENGRYH